MRHLIRNAALLVLLMSCIAPSPAVRAATRHKTQNVIFVVTDGLRWQEIFNGADSSLMNKENGQVSDEAALKKTYWREPTEERRTPLMPFLWTTMAKNGQVFGNRRKGSEAYVTNHLNFSYPGYSETLCGFADPRVNSNHQTPNPNVTVLEWLNAKPAYHGKVGAFGAWDTISYIVNAERSGITTSAGYDPLIGARPPSRSDLLNRLKAELPRVWDGEPFDAIPFYTALEYLTTDKPRILYVSLGENG